MTTIDWGGPVTWIARPGDCGGNGLGLGRRAGDDYIMLWCPERDDGYGDYRALRWYRWDDNVGSWKPIAP